MVCPGQTYGSLWLVLVVLYPKASGNALFFGGQDAQRRNRWSGTHPRAHQELEWDLPLVPSQRTCVWTLLGGLPTNHLPDSLSQRRKPWAQYHQELDLPKAMVLSCSRPDIVTYRPQPRLRKSDGVQQRQGAGRCGRVLGASFGSQSVRGHWPGAEAIWHFTR